MNPATQWSFPLELGGADHLYGLVVSLLPAITAPTTTVKNIKQQAAGNISKHSMSQIRKSKASKKTLSRCLNQYTLP